MEQHVVDRRFRRMHERELSKINLEFATLCRAFEESLFSHDWDQNKEMQDLPIFQKFNEIWLAFCNNYTQTSRSKILNPDPHAFHNYALDQSNIGTKPWYFTVTKNNGSNEETNGSGRTETSKESTFANP